MADSCGNTNLNPSVPCEQLDGQYKRPILLKDGFSFADQSAVTDAAYQTAIQNGDIIPLPKLFSTESEDSGVAYDSSTLGDITVSNGTISFKFMIAANTELYKKLASFSGNSQYTLGLITASGKLKLFKDSDGSLSGFGIGLLNVENPTLNDGSVAEKAPVKITLEDISEFRDSAVVFKPEFKILRKNALSDVKIEILIQSATEITFTVNKFSDNEAVQDANPIYGLGGTPQTFENDFALLDGSGAAQTVTGLSGGTVATSGVYTATGAAFVTGVLGLLNSSLMTTTGYSGVSDETVTIP